MNYDRDIIDVLGETKTATQFINLFMSIENYMDFTTEKKNNKETYKKIRNMMASLDMSYSKMPADNLKLNIFLGLCSVFCVPCDYLSNYKRAIIEGKLNIAFEYNKMGIYRKCSKDSIDYFEKEILEKWGREYLKSYLVINDFYQSKIHKNGDTPPLMYPNLIYHIFQSIGLEKKLTSENAIRKICHYHSIYTDSWKKEDNLTNLLYFIRCGKYQNTSFDQILRMCKEHLSDSDKLSFEKELREIYNCSIIVGDLEEGKKVIFSGNADIRNEKKTEKDIGHNFLKCNKTDKYIMAKFHNEDFYLKRDDLLMSNSPIFENKENMPQVFEIKGIASSYTFSWAVNILKYENFYYFRKNFDMAYLSFLFSDLKVFGRNDLSHKVLLEATKEMENSDQFNISEENPWNDYYYGPNYIILPQEA